MRIHRRHFLLLLAFAAVGCFFGSPVSAQSRAVIDGINTAAACFDETEAAFVAAGENISAVGNDAIIAKIDKQMPFLDKLIGCGDTVLKIKGMPLQARRGLSARRQQYVDAKELYTIQSCVFKKLDESEKVLPAVTKNIEAGDRLAALVAIQTARVATSRSKFCAEDGIASKTIAENLKTGFRQSLAEANSLLKQIEDLRARIEKLPEK